MIGKEVLENTTAQPNGVLAKQVDSAWEVLSNIVKAEEIGEHLRVKPAGERVVTHSFQCLKFGYHGWAQAATLARVPHARLGTVCETDLLPGEDALLIPVWTPWAQRLQPGDLGRKNVTFYNPDDPFLGQGHKANGKDADELTLWELGPGRKRVVSRAGRDAAAKHWLYDLHSHTELDRNGNLPENPCSTCEYL